LTNSLEFTEPELVGGSIGEEFAYRLAGLLDDLGLPAWWRVLPLCVFDVGEEQFGDAQSTSGRGPNGWASASADGHAGPARS
jgi:hypothetical protein